MSNFSKHNKHSSEETRFSDVCVSGVGDTQKSSSAVPFLDTLLKVALSIPKKLYVIAAAVIAMVVVIAIILSSVSTHSSPNTFAYVKDGQLNFSTVAKANGDVVFDEEAPFSSSTVQISDDGKRLFYLDKDRDLYLAKTSSLSKEAKKIASSVNSYYVIGDGKTIVYTNVNNKLCSLKVGKEPVSIDTNVEDFIPSQDGKKIIYSKESKSDFGSDWYITKNSAKPKKGEKISSGAEFEYVSKDFTKFVYVKNESLYSLTLGKDEHRIAKNVSNFVKVYDSGEIYFTREEKNNNDEYSSTKYSLWYYSGKNKEPVKVSNRYDGFSDYAQDVPVIIYYSRTEDYAFSYTIAVRDETYDVSKAERYLSYDLSDDGKEVLYLKDIDKEVSDAGILCKAKVAKGFQDEKNIDKNVSHFGYRSDKIFYVKDFDYDLEMGALYFDGKLLSDKSYDAYINYIDKTNIVVYKTNYDDDTDLCTFNFSKGNKVITSQEGVSKSTITNNGEVLMVVDPIDNRGDLLLFNGTKNVKQVDTDVETVFIPTCFTSLYTEIERNAIIY